MTSSAFDAEGPRVALYSSAFAADPHRAYREMRERYGSLVPVDLAPGVPATLVIGYRTAIHILYDPDLFSADPRTWQSDIPSDCPVLPILQWRPTAIRSAGAEHARYRHATVAAIEGVDLAVLCTTVQGTAMQLIDAFCETGAADLITQYAFPLAFQVINAMLGCPPDIGQRAAAGLAAMFDGINAAQGNATLAAALMELVARRRIEPSDDIATRLLASPALLDDVEIMHQLVPMYGAGVEPLLNLISNTLLLILTDERFADNVLGGSLTTRDALDEVLFNDPPLANFCFTYPRHPVLIESLLLPAHQPVVISMAACNNDPEIRGDDHTGNRSHLAWGLGPHACPARQAGYLIAQQAVEQLLDILPDIQLAVAPGELEWRPGPFHRALAMLPVTFPASNRVSGENISTSSVDAPHWTTL
ncbi:cytochrome P450 [Nocardia sp. CA-107356]|uniref:cytochrome P450 n=1 Tax=Nocardia sp. CA-107356 TaxID=3239972 RepID=UPI003D92731A